MRVQAILVLALFLTVRTVAQGAAKHPTQAQCKFSDGETITVMYSSEETRTLRLLTGESLVTIKGVDVPAGEYTVYPTRDAQNNWTLMMRKQIAKGEAWALPPLPMSVKAAPSSAGNFPVSFDRTGGSCMMHWSPEKSGVLLSLEFAVKNADLPTLTQ
jgi:Protein of unknown function (DUF2911)